MLWKGSVIREGLHNCAAFSAVHGLTLTNESFRTNIAGIKWHWYTKREIYTKRIYGKTKAKDTANFDPDIRWCIPNNNQTKQNILMMLNGPLIQS